MTPEQTTPPIPVQHYMNVKLVTSWELCEAFSIGETTLRKWRGEGMPCVHIGRSTEKGARGLRFNLMDVRRWLDRREASRRAASRARQDNAPTPAP